LSVTCPEGDLISENYGLETAGSYIDPAYPQDYCTEDINSDGRDAYPDFHHDSVVSDDFPAPNYVTIVHQVFGSADLTDAVPLGTEWYNAVTSVKTQACVTGAPHELPEDYNGATTIVNDIIDNCN
jgi:hypothetical protein